MEGNQGMEVKNTPLLFQQELNTYYKDILNCEITHPPYWDGKVPETFFLRKRKGIDPYQDWLGDEVIDYIKFDNSEYAIVKTDTDTQQPNIKIKKWLNEIDTSSIATIVNSNRTVEVTQCKFEDSGVIGDMNVITTQFSHNGKILYIFSQCDYTIGGETTTEVFVSEYELAVPYNINPSTVKNGHTYMLSMLSELSNGGNVICKIDTEGRNLYGYAESIHKFFQVKISTNRDITTLSNNVTFSDELTASLQGIKNISISIDGMHIFFVNGSNTIGCLSFHYNDISSDNSVDSKTIVVEEDDEPIENQPEYIGICIGYSGDKLYAAYNGIIYQLEGSNPYDISSFELTDKSILINDNDDKSVQDIDILNEYILISNDDLYVTELTWEHAKTLITQKFNPNVNHSFKRDFQSCKGEPLYGGLTTDTITGSTDAGIHKLTPTTAPSPAWENNEYAGKYVMIFGGSTTPGSETGVGGGQIFQIKSNTSTYLTVGGWDTKPNQSTYAIFEDFGETLSFIGEDGVYVIHSDTFIKRLEGLNNNEVTAVVDATRNNGRIFEILTNGLIACSATQTSSGENALYGGQYAGFFNGSSTIGNVTGAIRIVPFKEIVVVFTNDSIYIIKNETINVTVSDEDRITFTADAYPINLAFDFVGLLHRNAVCAYNTGIYFISDKKEFLSLNIEESYYNKYKITTEDLGIDIQQWLDGIKEGDDIAIGIDTKTIYIIWNSSDKSTIFQYDTYYSFWHRWETQLMIKNIRVDTHQTYMGYITYRYGLSDEKLDCYSYDYIQHLRWFNGDTDIFSLKTILYHKLYLGVNTSPDTKVIYNATLSDGLYKYELPLKQIRFLQKAENLNNEGVLGKGILGFSPLGGKAEDIIRGEYLSEVDVLEAPLGLSYSLLEIIVEGDFETGGNILGCLVHEPHLTAYEDVIPYLDGD